MKWQIDYSKSSLKFIKNNNINRNDITNTICNALKKLKGENINIDIKKMKGNWKGYFRVRDGKIRLIISIDFNNSNIYLDRIDYRGDVYK